MRIGGAVVLIVLIIFGSGFLLSSYFAQGTTMKKLEEQLATDQTQLRNLEEQLEEAQNQRRILEDQLTAAQSQIVYLERQQAENVTLQARVQELEAALRTVETDNTFLLEELEHLRNQATIQNQALDEVTTRTQKAEVTLEYSTNSCSRSNSPATQIPTTLIELDNRGLGSFTCGDNFKGSLILIGSLFVTMLSGYLAGYYFTQNKAQITLPKQRSNNIWVRMTRQQVRLYAKSQRVNSVPQPTKAER